FQRSFETQNIKSADHFGKVLLTAKKNLIPLSKFSQAKGLPEDLKTVFKKDLEEFVEEIKKSLKENLPKSGNDKEKMILIINSFRLPENVEENSVQNDSKNIESSPLRRKIIF
ncbi:MAG: hypothetical protein J0I88_04150, partial [Chryseobacterium sp.]|nr:hypothetical protein [Chryseobacterium sp.]